jgi:hypothetical protein
MLESSAWPTARRIFSCASTWEKVVMFRAQYTAQPAVLGRIDQSIDPPALSVSFQSCRLAQARRSRLFGSIRISFNYSSYSLRKRFKLSRQAGSGLRGYEA